MPDERDNSMACQEAQTASFLYLNDVLNLAPELREAFKAHLLICPTCADAHEENRWPLHLLKRQVSSVESTRKSPARTGCAEGEQREDICVCGKFYRPMTVEEGWKDIERRCPNLAAACHRERFKRRLGACAGRVGRIAAAACILIAIGIGWMAWRNAALRRPLVVATPSLPTVAFAEMVTDCGREPLALGLPLTTADRPQEVLLGGMHRVVMNRDTKATFEASSALAGQGGDTAYEIRLAQGELYVEVVPGHPLAVKTPNARLDITGTKFDVRANGERTEVTLLKGGVHFSRSGGGSRNEFVSVTAGHASAVVGQSLPSIPRKIDALAVTAWARDLALANALAGIQADADLHLLDSVRDCWSEPATFNLASVDYVQWRDDHREWVAQQFPWIFAAQTVLRERHGVDVDYIDLLMLSGDAWQFHYPRSLQEPIPTFEPAAMERLARRFAVPETELPNTWKIGGASRPGNEPCGLAYAQEMRLWHGDLRALASQPRGLPYTTLLFSLRAGAYLSNTRMAALLWARRHPQDMMNLLSDPAYPGHEVVQPSGSEECDNLEGCLQCQVLAIAKANCAVRELLALPADLGCRQQAMDILRELTNSVAMLVRADSVLDQERSR